MAKTATPANPFAVSAGSQRSAGSLLPGWAKLALAGLGLALLYSICNDVVLFVVIALGFLAIGLFCMHDWGNVVLTVLVLFVAVLLTGTVLGDPMRNAANGVKGLGDAGAGSVAEDLGGIRWPDNGPATTTTLAPIPVATP